MEIILITGRPNMVGSARVYVIDRNDAEVEMVVRAAGNESARVVVPFDSPISISGTMWIVRPVGDTAHDLDETLPGAPIPAALLVSVADA